MVSSDSNVFEDLSGATVGAFNNPYDALILAFQNDQVCLASHIFPTRLSNSVDYPHPLLRAIIFPSAFKHLDPGFGTRSARFELWHKRR